MKKDTSWGKVARWYADHVEQDDSYHQNVVLPNILRLMNIKPELRVLDLACGSGFFTEEFHKAGAVARGIDIGSELIRLAKKNYPNVSFEVAPAHSFPSVPDASVDVITLILAIQNIREVKEMLAECRRVLAPFGKMYIVMNHPIFRIPEGSSWQWDESQKTQ